MSKKAFNFELPFHLLWQFTKIRRTRVTASSGGTGYPIYTSFLTKFSLVNDSKIAKRYKSFSDLVDIIWQENQFFRKIKQIKRCVYRIGVFITFKKNSSVFFSTNIQKGVRNRFY
jgi:hypothetical protein